MTSVTRGERHIALSIVVTGDEPPSEFRIFTSGQVDTVKGKFLFDAKAASSVMAEYAAHGIDVMIDYDHASLGVAIDPAQSGKAAGWFNLAVRNGELWAVNVRWCPPAAEALKRKEWRYMSPAFNTDDAGRVTSLLNVAITNLPATRKLDPLMAANLTSQLGANAMTLEEFLKVVKALGIDMTTPLDEAMAKIKGDPDAGTEDAPPPAGDGGADDGTEPAPPMADKPPPDEVQAAVAASISRLTRITDKKTIGEAVEEVETWRKSHVELSAEKAKLAKEREALEYGQRKENAIALTKLGAETPHTTGLAKGKLCKRLLDEPLAEQSERVKALLAARGGKLPVEATPPAGGETAGEGSKTFTVNGQPVTLDARELKICAEQKCAPETFAMLKARRAEKRA